MKLTKEEISKIESCQCIYYIRNTHNGKLYIGSTVDFKKRLISHLSRLNNGKANQHLQSAYLKYGQDIFECGVLEIVDSVDMLCNRESFYINKFDTLNPKNGYNIVGHDVEGGRFFTQETKNKISKSRCGKKLSQSHCDSISLSNKGKKPKQHTIDAAIKSRVASIELVSPNGEIVTITNITKFCKNNGLDRVCIYRVINGQYEQHKNWRLKCQ